MEEIIYRRGLKFPFELKIGIFLNYLGVLVLFFVNVLGFVAVIIFIIRIESFKNKFLKVFIRHRVVIVKLIDAINIIVG